MDTRLLATLKAPNGTAIYVNPDHVIAIRSLTNQENADVAIITDAANSSTPHVIYVKGELTDIVSKLGFDISF